MKNQIKIVVIWAIIALGLCIHSAMETGEALFFKTLPEEPFNEGLPMEVHIIYILAMIFPMVMAFLHLFYTKKRFLIFSMVYAGLLTLLNVFHVVETIMGGIGNISQVVLLLFVAIANIALVVLLNKSRNEPMASAA